MKVVILAGGQGGRLAEKTSVEPRFGTSSALIPNRSFNMLAPQTSRLGRPGIRVVSADLEPISGASARVA